jgi:hypothetical protein
MPNDCLNIIYCFSHADLGTIKRVLETLGEETTTFFAKILPCPQGETPETYWGIKYDAYDILVEEVTDNTLRVSFYTPWSPPLEAYEHLRRLGFTVDAIFMESGCDFCGYWKDGKTTLFENVSENRDSIPFEFHYYFFSEEKTDDSESVHENDK